MNDRLKLGCVVLGMLLVGGLFAPSPLQAQEQASILNPILSKSSDYFIKANAIDPIGTTGSAALPGANQVIIYTPASALPQGDVSVFAVVVNDQTVMQAMTTTNPESISIPAGGFVVLGRGSSAQWLSRFARPGAQAWYDVDTRQVTIRHTPQVYLNALDTALEKARQRLPVDVQAYSRALQQAETCRTELAMQTHALTSAFTERAEACIHEAERAFYATIPSYPGEFRGAWLRPNSIDPEKIRRSIASLRQLGIQHVFLETYYQGRTSYPSEVMRAYGLPVQHAQFMGSDPVRLWIDEAHRAGLKVHLWVEVFFAGNSDENPEPYGPILQQYPQWRNVQQRHWRKNVPVISDVEPGHFFLDPANPEVRAFLEKLLLEMVTNYEADGLNLDYIRYPASAAVTQSNYLNTTWGYTEAARNAFESMIRKERPAPKNGKGRRRAPVPSVDPVHLTPSNPLWPRWVEWRKNLITGFVKNISEKARAVRPNMLISAVVFPSTDPLYSLKLQDYPAWAKAGCVQALTPIGLSPRPDWMRRQSERLKQQVDDRVPVYVGIFGMYNRLTPVEFLEQIDAVHQAGMPGVMIFEWSRLRPEYEEALREGPFRE